MNGPFASNGIECASRRGTSSLVRSVQRRTQEGAKRPRRPSDCNGGLAGPSQGLHALHDLFSDLLIFLHPERPFQQRDELGGPLWEVRERRGNSQARLTRALRQEGQQQVQSWLNRLPYPLNRLPLAFQLGCHV